MIRAALVSVVLIVVAACAGSRKGTTAPPRAAAKCDPSCCQRAQTSQGSGPTSGLGGLGIAVDLQKPGAASGQIVTWVDRSSLLELFRGQADQVQILEGRKGGPPFLLALVTKVGKFLIIPGQCEGGRCRTLQFYYGIQTDGRTPATVANEFNRRFRFGRAYVDEQGDPCLEWDVDLEPGVTRAAVTSAFKVFEGLVVRYLLFLQNKTGTQQPTSQPAGGARP